MRAAIIQNGIVVNVTNTKTLDHPDGLEMIQTDIAGIGWGYVDGEFVEPAGPTPEEAMKALKEAGEQAITQRIQAVVDAYNSENGTAFDNVHNCESYSRVDGYTHQAFCLAVWTWNVAVWEAARTALIQSMAGEITITSVDDLLVLLPEFTE